MLSFWNYHKHAWTELYMIRNGKKFDVKKNRWIELLD